MNTEEIRNKIILDNINWKHIFTTNCYAFALGLDIKERSIMKDAYQPGTISNNNLGEWFTYGELLSNLKSDFDYLGIDYKEINPTDNIAEDEWKIALFIKIYNYNYGKIVLSDFHFLRQIGDSWYHKPGYYGLPTNKDSNDKIITDPTMCNIYNKAYQKTYSLKLKKN